MIINKSQITKKIWDKMRFVYTNIRKSAYYSDFVLRNIQPARKDTSENTKKNPLSRGNNG